MFHKGTITWINDESLSTDAYMRHKAYMSSQTALIYQELASTLIDAVVRSLQIFNWKLLITPIISDFVQYACLKPIMLGSASTLLIKWNFATKG